MYPGYTVSMLSLCYCCCYLKYGYSSELEIPTVLKLPKQSSVLLVTLQLQKSCRWVDVFQTWSLLEKETCLGFFWGWFVLVVFFVCLLGVFLGGVGCVGGFFFFNLRLQ